MGLDGEPEMNLKQNKGEKELRLEVKKKDGGDAKTWERVSNFVRVKQRRAEGQ